jgi:predicted nucleic acid-binding protein
MPDSDAIYIDTSVLVKWFVIEAYTRDVVEFFNQGSPLILSELVLLELDCSLRRMERSGAITNTYRLQTEKTLALQLQEAWFQLTPISMQVFKEAKLLIDSVAPLSLRSLDAMHLTIAKKAHIKRLATADKEMATVAQSLHFSTHYFNN